MLLSKYRAVSHLVYVSGRGSIGRTGRIFADKLAVSRLHCKLERLQDFMLLTDVSQNGTYGNTLHAENLDAGSCW